MFVSEQDNGHFIAHICLQTLQAVEGSEDRRFHHLTNYALLSVGPHVPSFHLQQKLFKNINRKD